MSAGSYDMPPEAVTPPKAPSPTRPFYWSVRRELWENRSIHIAPLVAAGIALFGYLMGALYLPGLARPAGTLTTRHSSLAWSAMQNGGAMPMRGPAEALIGPYDFAASVVTVTGVIVALFYCLGALSTERRDRSILFWKSLPVSDLTTVAAKAAVPLLVVPVTLLATAVAAQLVMLLLNAIALVTHGKSAVVLLTDLPLVVNWLTLTYGLAAITLWYAPVYAWLLLISGWARRGTFLWAVMPPAALCVVEWLGLRTNYFARVLGDRLTGPYSEAFSRSANRQLVMDPLKFLSAPGLWIGLAIAAAFLAGAVWQRRYREPT